MKQQEFPLLGLHCAGCAGRAEQVLNKLDGVKEASVNLATASAIISYDEEQIKPNHMAKAIAEAGYQLVVERDIYKAEEKAEALRHKEEQQLRVNLGISLIACLIIMVSMHWGDNPTIALLNLTLSTLVIVTAGRGFYRRAFSQLLTGGMGMDTLVTLSTLVAYIYSLICYITPDLLSINGHTPHTYFEAPVMIIAFVLLGKALEAKAKSNTTTAIKQLMGLQPKQVQRQKIDGTSEEVDIYDLLLGDLILVRAGERIAVDGIVSSGSSYVDESMLTGEPIPVNKTEGEKVFAGSINQNGSLTIRATALHHDTLLGRIIQRVRSAQGSKAPIQKLVDRVAAVFVPVIITLSVLTFGLWYLLGGDGSSEQALISAVTVLVIACPCALGLATPTAIMVGIGRAAEQGILIKDAESLEVAKKIDTIVFDKTGTLSKGKPSVIDVKYHSQNEDTATLQALLYEIEKRSDHPIAQAISNYTSASQAEHLEVSTWENIPGRGVKASIGAEQYLVGNRELLMEHNIVIPQEALDAYQHNQSQLAATAIFFANSQSVLATLAISDELKDESKQVVSDLQKAGIGVCLLTGDNQQVAEVIGKQLGIQHIKAGVLPEEKADFIASLKAEGKQVAMVGDGINDSAALAEANLSIAMGTGSDIAIETAMATITTGDISKLPELLRLSKLTISTIQQNLFWAFIYNLIAIPIAAGAFYAWTGWTMTPMIASLAMAMSSVSVVLNSLRLKYR